MAIINNVHFEYAATMMGRKSGITCGNEAEFVLIKSNMAIAYEARTQNLIALRAQEADPVTARQLYEEILERLYV